MRAAFGRADVTPPLGTPMAGQLVAYPASGIESPLHAIALVLADDDDGKKNGLLPLWRL